MSLRPQEINRAKLPLLFKREFELCNVSAKETIVLLTDLKVGRFSSRRRSRPKRSALRSTKEDEPALLDNAYRRRPMTDSKASVSLGKSVVQFWNLEFQWRRMNAV